MYLRAALYIRVSTEDQAKEGFSIPAQLKRLQSYCKARGWEIAGEYIDSGYSGRDVKRPAYQKMMQEKDNWDVIVVLKMDRIHRNSKNFATMMEDLRKWGKEFNSMQESFDTTSAIGRFVMDIIQRIAQLESEQIGERVKMGMMQKARKGKGYLGFGVPYGYNYQDGQLVPIETEQQVIKKIFEWYLTGLSLNDISERLNAMGIPTKKGRRWKKGTVGKILSNPLYCGFIKWDNLIVKAPHQRSVSVELFNAAQEMKRIRRRTTNLKNDSGIVYHEETGVVID
ncbi:MAG: recombinase family protein [Methanomassiliicoccales archaeon]|nr:recombinase family protein [Methanomassiliicoccales archaeon]